MFIRRLQGTFLLLVASFLFTACSDKNEALETASEENEVKDEDLIAVVENNVKMLMNEDLEGYMDTIHSESPAYESTEKTISDLLDSSLNIEIIEVEVKEKSEEEAIVSYIQHVLEEEDQKRKITETEGEHTLRLDDEEWKIYQSEVIAVDVVSVEEADEEEVEIEGEYSDQMESLSMPFSDEDWQLASYEEGDGEARVEYIPLGENLGDYEEVLAYDFYENGNELSSLANFISVMELSLEEMVTGELDYSRLMETESEVIYQFNVREDNEEPNQAEIGRVFVSEDDFYIIRYTTFEETIEDEEEIIELLREVG